jgi:hypothetical protein
VSQPENIPRSVDIAIQCQAALRTNMQTNAQILPNAPPATRTDLAGVARIHRHDLDSGLDSLVGEQRTERPQSNVMGGAGELTVLKEELERQIFENDCAIGIYQLPGDLVPPIPPLVGDMLVQASDFPNGFAPILAALLLARYGALQHAQGIVRRGSGLRGADSPLLVY